MFCQNCGNQVKDEALFCNKCGKQIDGNITRQYVRETPVVPIHIPSSKSVFSVISSKIPFWEQTNVNIL